MYKQKKPVRFPFLDFSTREARESACRREVALNSRLAPDVYRGVATVLGPDGEPCDHLVVMRRMPDSRRLSNLLGSRDAAEHMRRIAKVMAAFHAEAATSAEIDSAATAEAVAQNWRDNFEEVRRFAGRYLDAGALARAEGLAVGFLAGRRALFDHRIAAGKIRDGHGDLLADDIFCLPDGPRILDCIEFSDRLRYGDVLSDIAFLAMDLERLGRPDLAVEFVNRYREFSGEDAPEPLVHHYIAYRAQVRSKVACLRAEQGDPEAAAEAARLLEIAVRHLERARVRLVLIGGLPGTGKTTLAHLISEDRGWAHWHSDDTRKELAGIPPSTPAPAPYGEGLYAGETTRATYRA
ncbi:MAG: phosphotransferase, partial [Actinomycetota bacterium]